jgi:uncharacterized membrane protein
MRPQAAITPIALALLCVGVNAWAWHGDSTTAGWFGRFHPVVVHFPIALVVAAGLAEVVALRTGDARYSFAARFMLYVAAIAAVVAASLGFAAATGESYDGVQADYFNYHRVLGIVLPVLTFLTLGLCESARRTGETGHITAYRVLLLLSILVVLVMAYFGGTLVFGVDHFF